MLSFWIPAASKRKIESFSFPDSLGTAHQVETKKMAPKLELCMTVRGYIGVGKDAWMVPNVMGGPTRLFIPVTGGTITGVGPAAGLEAKIHQASSDAALVRYQAEQFEAARFKGHICRHEAGAEADVPRSLQMNSTTNTAHLNVRVGAQTTEGDVVFVQYQGILKVTEAGQKVFAAAADAKSTDYGEQEWFTTPRIETSSEKFKWMEETVWIGQGHFVVDEVGSAVEYQVYRLVN
jgi:hypothetical protein